MNVAATSATYSFGLDEVVDDSTTKSNAVNTVRGIIYQTSDKSIQEYGRLVISRFAFFFDMLLAACTSRARR